MSSHAAVDLGAGSGRVLRGELSDGCLVVQEVLRFANEPVRRGGHLRWDLPRLLHAVREGLVCAGNVDSVGVDAWGVDFGLLDEDERLLEWPVTYRDARTDGAMARFLNRVPAEDVYATTGIQFLPFNTLYQLAALAGSDAALLDRARHLLLMPDLVLHDLAGTLTTEWTNATTTQLVDAGQRTWSTALVEALGVPRDLLPEIVPPGSRLGALQPSVRRATGLGAVEVVAPATHDTASAVAAVPFEGPHAAYVSSGTWSLVGVETDAPVIGDETRRLGFTNEGGVGGTNRLLRNVMGLWLLRRCRADFDKRYTYDQLVDLAAAATPFASLVDVDDPRFLAPPSMPEALAAYCRETGQPVPATPGALARTVLESLALGTRRVLEDLRRVVHSPIERLHIVGGGSRNALLCRMTAAATGLEVVAGPVEATAVGNLLVQAMALGNLDGLAALRAVVRRSFDALRYAPRDVERWDEAAERLGKIREEARA